MQNPTWTFHAALKPIFAHIPNVYLIHYDLIITGKTFNEHNLALEEVMKAIDQANLTLNSKNCSFGKSDFIPNFSKSISTLRELLNSDKNYKWTETHQKVFNNVIDKFKKETLLSYFLYLKTFIHLY